MTEKIAKISAEELEKLVSLTIDKRRVSVPEGTLLVDAAKMAGIDIPVFCYHPKMEPVGMCRMCLVKVGRPAIDRASGQAILDKNGKPRIDFGPKLETGCTVPVSEGMVVRGYTEEVGDARKEVLEFLLTSHPLDCPICDKGGECPLQNLTMEFGPGESRYLYDEKKNLEKHVPLGDLIFLDRERCIQCARCTRFQAEVVDDPVIAFSQRGRALEIVTFSEPGFDSYWSGNTTDICPVGALTTADFRFGARPWEMDASASICNHCPVGCNTTLNTRREAKSGGKEVIKRVMPRQNELVNEIWMCDKGRFGYHYTESEARLTEPLIRRDGELQSATWEEAVTLIGEKFSQAGENLLSLAGGRLSNEDYFNLVQLSEKLGGRTLLDSQMAGGDLLAELGLGQGTNLADLGEGDAILVIASDLEEEAPLYWLRVKQAAERGAKLIVANPRHTKLDDAASCVLRYSYGEESALVHAMLDSLSPKRADRSAIVKGLLRKEDLKQAAQVMADIENLIVFFGSEGTSLESSQSLSLACANLLIATGHVGRTKNGLVAVWDKGNAQGAWDMGLRPSLNLHQDLGAASTLYLVGSDLFADDPALFKVLKRMDFVVVQDIAHNKVTEIADVVLPAQAFTEREGSYTNSERRVQRFYPAVVATAECRPDFAISAAIAKEIGLHLEEKFAAQVFHQISQNIADYIDLSYAQLAETHEQWPLIGREDVYYGGTTYHNSQGLGVQLLSGAEKGANPLLSFEAPFELQVARGSLLAVPITRLYDRGSQIAKSDLLAARLEEPQVILNPLDAEQLALQKDAPAKLTINGHKSSVTTKIDPSLEKGFALIPRSLGIPIFGPTEIELKAGN